jgi:hypothetical protein
MLVGTGPVAMLAGILRAVMPQDAMLLDAMPQDAMLLDAMP